MRWVFPRMLRACGLFRDDILRNLLFPPHQPDLEPLGIELDIDGEELADTGLVHVATVALYPPDQVSGNAGADTCTRDPGIDNVFACETLLP